MPLSLIGDWEKANHNKVGIYVYIVAQVELMGVSEEWVCLMRRPPADQTFEKDVKLLLHKGHYSLILDFQKLICRQHKAIRPDHHNGATHACHRCLRYFPTSEELDRHLYRQDCIEDIPHKVEKSLPKVKDGSPPLDLFKNVHHMLSAPLIVIADFETDWNPDDYGTARGDKTTLLGRNKHCLLYTSPSPRDS